MKKEKIDMILKGLNDLDYYLKSNTLKDLTKEQQDALLLTIDYDYIINNADELRKQYNINNLHLTSNHTDKMALLWSISTSSTINPICKARAKDKTSICSRCFALRLLKRYDKLEIALIKNTIYLTTHILTVQEIPLIPVIYFRFEAFGDLMNATQAYNYLSIARYNPQTLFAIWTKNPRFIDEAIKKYEDNNPFDDGKPENLQIVYGSPKLNKCDNVQYNFIDKTFTVYDSKTIDQNHININCGANSCFKCHQCYKPNDEKEIREKLK